ncbi:MAG: SRPBCC family protein [Archaeoglobaceae archaeon]
MSWRRAFKLGLKTFVTGVLLFLIGFLMTILGILFVFTGVGILGIAMIIAGLLIAATSFFVATLKVVDSMIREAVGGSFVETVVRSIPDEERVPILSRLGGEIRISKSVEIEAPVDRGFEYITNVENVVEWLPIVTRCEQVEGEGLLAVKRYVVRLGRRSCEFRTCVIEWDPPRKYAEALETRDRKLRELIHEGILKKTETGFRYYFRLSLKLGPPLLGWLRARKLKGELEASVAKGLENLKRKLEREIYVTAIRR